MLIKAIELELRYLRTTIELSAIIMLSIVVTDNAVKLLSPVKPPLSIDVIMLTDRDL
jgi:hypothetical protein